MPGLGPALAAALALLATSGRGLMAPWSKSIVPERREEEITPEILEEARGRVAPLAPLVMKIDVCGGLTNQRVALVDGIVLSLFTGMQILLPDYVPLDGTEGIEGVDREMSPMNQLINVEKASSVVEKVYRDYWCNRPGMRSELWCPPTYKPIIAANATAVMDAFRVLQRADPDVTMLTIKQMGLLSTDDMAQFNSEVDSVAFKGFKRGYLDAGCTIFSLTVLESNAELWSLWWHVNDALEYMATIEAVANRFIELIGGYGALAQTTAGKQGFPRLRGGAPMHYNFLHLRAEEDWVEHCSHWMSIPDGRHRDNCMNNTMSIAQTLLAGGLDPRLPLYVGTGISLDELKQLNIPDQHGSGFQGLASTFTVVTKDDILKQLKCDFDREQWAAVDFLVANKAKEFVGNSVSTFSAYIIVDRHRRGLAAWHYNGGVVPLKNRVSKWLVYHGVRVIHHWPHWADELHGNAARFNAAHPDAQDAKPLDPDALIGTILRMDIPILGMLDEFVLYTDVDVMFQSDVTWGAIFRDMNSRALYEENDFARGHQSSPPLPVYLPAPSRESYATASVMLINMRAFRAIYESLTTSAVSHMALGLATGSPQMLPDTMHWKSHWEANPKAMIVHFNGLQCGSDNSPTGVTEAIAAAFVQNERTDTCIQFNAYSRKAELQDPAHSRD